MQVLLRTRRTRADGIGEYLDTEINATALTLGSAPDQTLQLIGPNIVAQHALIKLTDGAAQITCRRGASVLVNGAAVRAAALHEGDDVEIDGHHLQLVTPPAGFDVALEIRPNAEVQSSDFARAFRTDLTQTWLSKRRASWLLFSAILTLALLVPLGTLVWPFVGAHLGTNIGAPVEALVKTNREAHRPWLPADAQWSTGALLPAHQLAIGDDCNACHAVPFQRVADAQCTACHDRTSDHVEASVASKAGLAHTRCATCHQEHHEPPHLVVTADTLCTDCHADPARFSAVTKLAPASGFANTTHPAFEAHLLRAVGRQAGTGLVFDWHFESSAITGAKETSNLRFPHDVHLNGEKVQRVNDSAPLHCADCHQLSPDKEHFIPVTMEQHCASCHDLKFDPTDPTRELPHGQPMEAILAIEGHYLRKFGDPNLSTTVSTKRRLPDRGHVDDRCTDSVYACAMRKTQGEAVNQFTRRGCVTCHIVEDSGNKDIYSRFQVYPIRLVSNYLPTARFDHASHLTQKDKTGDAACGSCHDALHSKHSADLLIPDIDNCVECHGDNHVTGGITLSCIACHGYHPDQSLIATRKQNP